MARSSVYNRPAIQNLLKWVQATEARGLRVAADNRSVYDWNVPYVSRTALDEHFSIPLITELINALFDPLDPGDEGPDAGQIKRKYSKIFCLLITIGKGDFITNFVAHGIDDQRLPLGPDKPEGFPTLPSDADFYDEFRRKQWEFCVPELDFDFAYGRQYDHSDWILPIRHIKQLGEGGSATVHQVEVPGSYYQLDELPDKSHRGDCQSSCRHPPATFVLKCYRDTSGAKEYFENELRALKRVHSPVRCHQIVGYHGGFTLGCVHNVVLEYADKGTLWDFLEATPSPSTASDIIAFYASLLPITRGLVRIHNGYDNSQMTRGQQIFQGWHHDITPRNIIVKSRSGKSIYDFDCKLADLGLSHFSRYENRLHGDTDKDRHGTRTYGPPECLRHSGLENEDLKVKQNADVYSLGCVWSLVATWVARNWAAVLEYQDQRRKEIKELQGFREGDDFFHKGRDEVLDTVTNNHLNLRESVRSCDNITIPILDMVRDGMLCAPIARRDAMYLDHQTQIIIDQARSRLRKSRTTSPTSETLPSESGLFSPVLIPPRPPQNNSRLNFNPPPLPWTWSRDTYHQPLNPGINEFHTLQSHATPAGPTEDRSHTSGAAFGDESFNLNQVASKPGVARSQTQPSRDYERSLNWNDGSLPLPRRRADAASCDPHDSGSFASSPNTSPRRAEYTIRPTSEVHSQGHDPTSSTHTHRSQNQKSPPTWPAHAALRWKSVKKDPKNNENVCILDKYLLDELKGRDQAFLIDNSSSMIQYWSAARSLLDLLGYLVKQYDNDGLDIYFTCPFKKYSKIKTTTRLLEIFDRHKPHGHGKMSDMHAILSRIIVPYQEEIRKMRNRRSFWPKLKAKETTLPLSLYIFTDAVWQPVCDVTDVITSLVDTLKEQNLHKQQVGLQFIRFGNQAAGVSRLERLDKLKLNRFTDKDIVDTEPADGNVLKMLLGAINDWFDDDTPTADARSFDIPQPPGK